MAGMPYIVTKGIVLRETETKETDKILTLLTAERGCQRPVSGLFGMDPLSAGELVLCE